MRRRAFFSRAGGVTGALAFGNAFTAIGGRSVRGVTAENRVSKSRLLSGTKYETEVVTRKAGEGPTALVVGGMHGDEKAGYLAAEKVAEWPIRAGTLVVLPRANQPAIRKSQRENANGDLNRKFPPGERPETEIARAIWGLVEDTDPDVVLDLHRSRGIYRLHANAVGQVIWPTATGNAVEYAEETVREMNEEFVPWCMPYHEYRREGEISGDSPLLVHKAAGDLGRPGYIVETTSFLLDLGTRVRWEKRIAEKLLARHGIERTGSGGGRESGNGGQQ